MAYRLYTYILVLATGFMSVAGTLSAQQDKAGYELIPAPDLGYNDVDGIRVGIRLRGQVPGTYNDGPHRLELGMWLGTWIPDHPVSYYVRFTEPVPTLSEYGSEGNLQATSSFRTGFSRHRLTFNKRWQRGFNENRYSKLSFGFRAEHRRENEYLQYVNLWQHEWLYLLELETVFQYENGLGTYRAVTRNYVNVAGAWEPFLHNEAALQQLINLSDSFKIRARIFAGITGNNTAPEYQFARSFVSPVNWIDNGLTRAKGTIPTQWVSKGVFQISGGANLRGYIGNEIDILNGGGSPLLTSVSALNIELDYPNPLNKAIKSIPVAGELMELRSYLFFDTGTSLGITDKEEKRVLTDAGPGFMFTLNIPDYLGNPRGLMIRYDIPVWLSHPGIGPKLKWRSLIGIGAVFNI